MLVLRVFKIVESKKWHDLGLTIIKLGSIKPMGHTNKTSSIYTKSVQELGGYCTHSADDHNVGR